MPDFRITLRLSPCVCVRCDACSGSGTIQVGMDGLPNYGDDLYDLESCYECGGTGISEVCDRCRELEEFDHDDE